MAKAFFFVLTVCIGFIRSECGDTVTQSSCEGPDQSALLQERIKTDFGTHSRVGANLDKPHSLVTAQDDASHISSASPSASTLENRSNSSSITPWGKTLNRKKAPCNCVASHPTWKPCARTTPRCVFIDLGAADGNTFHKFLNNNYGSVANCPNGQWSAVLVEANPRFDTQLGALGKEHSNVTVLSSTAAYMCEGTTSFFLDTVNEGENYWASSMSSSNPNFLMGEAKEMVTVPTMNLNRILFEQTIPDDWVLAKMDIEGSEYDVLPCLAKAAAASLIDRLYMEQHDWLDDWGLIGTTAAEMDDAKAVLRNKGVDVPDYFSSTF